jgi:hypothetical protein
MDDDSFKKLSGIVYNNGTVFVKRWVGEFISVDWEEEATGRTQINSLIAYLPYLPEYKMILHVKLTSINNSDFSENVYGMCLTFCASEI